MQKLEDSSKSLLSLFDFSEEDSHHYFELIGASYWDTENNITKKYKSKINLLSEDSLEEKSKLEIIYKTLTNSKQRSLYTTYLLYQYTINQPNSLYLLTENYYSIIFPYYIFLLKTPSSYSSNTEELFYLLIDNINFSVNLYDKTILKQSFDISVINYLKINSNNDSLEIQSINDKTPFIIFPYISRQVELIYVLIMFMVIVKRRNDSFKKGLKKVNEINQNLEKQEIKTIFDENIEKILYSKININNFKILINDSYVPKGIKVATYISKDKGNKSNKDRYLIVGNTYLFFFKTDQLKELTGIIPIAPGYLSCEFDDIEKGIKIKFEIKEYNFYLGEEGIYEEIKNNLIQIFEGEYPDFSADDLYKISMDIIDDKTMGGMLENLPIYTRCQKDIEKLEGKLDLLKTARDLIIDENHFSKLIDQFP